MKKIKTTELLARGYREDVSEAHRTKRPFHAMLVLALLGFVAAFIAHAKGAAMIVRCLDVLTCGVFVCTALAWYFSQPRDPKTGKRLERYKNAAAEPGYDEIVYVNQQNKTFYRRVISTPDVGTGPS
jgi:hypothetical protein